MSDKVSRAVIAAAVLLVLAAVNGSIVAKERIKTHGEIILLELAPVDPRSLMQGDYMALRFDLAQQISPDKGGLAPLILDENRVARLDPGPRMRSCSSDSGCETARSGWAPMRTSSRKAAPIASTAPATGNFAWTRNPVKPC